MKILREGIVKTVPAMLERDKAVSLREQRKKEGALGALVGGTGEEGSSVGGYETRKRGRGGKLEGKSFAKSSREQGFLAPGWFFSP